MRFLKGILTGLISGVKKFIGFVKDISNSASETENKLNDITETVTAVATIAIGITAVVRHFKYSVLSPKTAVAGMDNGYVYSSVRKEEKSMKSDRTQSSFNGLGIKSIVDPKKCKRKKGERMYKEEGIELLNRISETRNASFNKLKPAQKLEVLRAEGFSVRSFLINEQRINGAFGEYRELIEDEQMTEINFHSPDGRWTTSWERFMKNPVRFIKRKLGIIVSPEKDADIFHYYPLAQSDMPFIPTDSVTENFWVTSLLPYYDFTQIGDIDEFVKPYTYDPIESMSAEEWEIRNDELLKHKSLKKYQKAVKKRMEKAGVGMSIYEMMGEYEDSEKKKKKGKKNKKGKKSSGDNYSIFYDDEPKKKKKGKKGKKKDSDDYVAIAEAKARKNWNFFLKESMAGNHFADPYDDVKKKKK